MKLFGLAQSHVLLPIVSKETETRSRTSATRSWCRFAWVKDRGPCHLPAASRTSVTCRLVCALDLQGAGSKAGLFCRGSFHPEHHKVS